MSDPALSTKDMARWMGSSTEYVRGEIVDGKIPFDNISRSPRRREYRVRLSDFIAYLRARGYRRLPQADDFKTTN